MAVDTFTSTDTWTCPADVTSVSVECWGAGASGGWNNIYGGGGGAYSIKQVTVVPTTEYTVTVGVGGAARTTTSNGLDGGDTWFSTSGTVLAKGGIGGDGSSGLGGSAASGVGDTKYSGGNAAIDGGLQAGGGGSSAGTAANGNNASGLVGGSAPTGGGKGGNANNNLGAVTGQAGDAPGGGGGSSNAAGGNSGAGADGKVTITYSLPLTSTTTDTLALTDSQLFTAGFHVLLSEALSLADTITSTFTKWRNTAKTAVASWLNLDKS